MSWRSWQRYEDYYQEGQFIWLDADTLIREQTAGKRSLDDFARAFFGIDDGSFSVVTYTFDDVVQALKTVMPYDWAGFLRSRLDAVDKPMPLDGVTRGGYRLIFTDTPSEISKARDAERKRVSLTYSIGVELDDQDGSVVAVRWDSPAFKAKITLDSQILAVNGTAYNGDSLKADIQAAKATSSPMELIVKTGDRFRVVSLDYHDGLRYPHLERNPAVPARLDDILDARK
jgi:predicted metalloprotease with PDZ domain